MCEFLPSHSVGGVGGVGMGQGGVGANVVLEGEDDQNFELGAMTARRKRKMKSKNMMSCCDFYFVLLPRGRRLSFRSLLSVS